MLLAEPGTVVKLTRKGPISPPDLRMLNWVGMAPSEVVMGMDEANSTLP